ncbi:hypothetical protein DEU56DRAFT_162228 [Suillus clintonianus]|uniref:uncharacterized protein n=1 Tax=Suillus clintonianus TaxID=1904413 RepID=UPI001B866A43|nr:uncharacterized protein DEU56DRAFT_162228 [Suillus clintonianus]KAG2116941.1 hypothetical protein DEU56DRAFT_162228 [Suillus clintonianus]
MNKFTSIIYQLAQDNTTLPLKSNPITWPRQRKDDSRVQHRELRNASSNSDLSPGQKSAPPPPPPSRSAKKPVQSPAVPLLLRPVLVPEALITTRQSRTLVSVHSDSNGSGPTTVPIVRLYDISPQAAWHAPRASSQAPPPRRRCNERYTAPITHGVRLSWTRG